MKNVTWLRRYGFRKRMSSSFGRKIINRQRLKGRWCV